VETALDITTNALPAGTVGSSYSTALQASGASSTYQWSVVAGQLPPGLSLGTSGVITGTPTTAGTFGFTVNVLSGIQNAQLAQSITVVGPSLPAVTGAYDGTTTVTCCAPAFTTTITTLTVSSGPSRWWLVNGPPYLLVPGLLSDPTQPFPTSFLPAFNVPAGGGFQVIFIDPNSATQDLSGTVGNGQLQFVWTVKCAGQPPFASIQGTCRVTFTGTFNPSP
jgi:hypothetical protein